MLPAKNHSVPADEKRLRRLFRQLPEQDRATLLRFAEFLAAGPAAVPVTDARLVEPLTIPRPERESVVKAIRRLSATYPMLDKERLLHQTSGLMSEHVIKGRAAAEIIDELEALFAGQYQQFKAELEKNQ
ncbi:MAG: hypothetical protein KDI44_06715 [Thiothrix sp.]|nr:hypothetical protein [Thiothrix sp.]HPQ94204.1 hypothetical protein [Thiolinea sp.]